MPGMPAFWAPSGPQSRRLTWGRARAPEDPKKAAQKEQPASQAGNEQQNTVNSSVLWLGSRVRARQKARKPTRKDKDRAAREPATAKAKRTEQQANAQHSSFWRYLSLQDLICIVGLEFTSHRIIFLYYFILIYLFIVFIFGLEIY